MTKRWEKLARENDRRVIRSYKKQANARSFALFFRLWVPLGVLVWLLWVVNR
jgi:hypothetical protein